MEPQSFRSHYSNNGLFIIDQNKTYVVDLINGTVTRGTEKAKQGKIIVIEGYKEGITDTKTIWAKEQEEKKLAEKTKGKFTELRDFLKEQSNKGHKSTSLTEIEEKLNLPQNELVWIIERLKSSGDVFEPKKGFISLI
jgi:hypothetical protein